VAPDDAAEMLTVTLCKFTHCRWWPAWYRGDDGWQFHWLWLYLEWRNDDDEHD
jgi:hypothetical protein